MPSSSFSHPDAELLQQIAAGCEQAFAALFHRYRADIYRFAMHMTASSATADDVTQEVFLAVMRDAARYEPERATVQAWLFGITRNHVRRRFDRDRVLQPLADDEEVRPAWAPDEAVDPLAQMTRAERIAMLRNAVLTLPIRYREALVLCDLQEMSYADAAAAIGCAVGTVRSRLHRARALLAGKLRETEQARDGIKLRGTRCFA